MIDWTIAHRLAGVVAGGAPSAGLDADLAGIARRSEELAGAYTGLSPAAGIPPAEGVSRAEWSEVNLAGMRSLLDPLGDKLGGNLGPLQPVLRLTAGALLGAEVGAITGYLAQRVLGQYEIALLDPAAPARLLFLTENLAEARDRMGADAEELVTWVALHEVTHAYQFSGVPWLREHLARLVRELLSTLEVRLRLDALPTLPARVDIRGWVETAREEGLVGLMASPAQRGVLRRLQALMALLEGYSEHVMDAVGTDLLPTLPDLREAMDRRRRTRSLLEALLQRLIGLDLKLRQYEQGKRFCDAVVDAGGLEALNRAWSAPAAVPTLAELDAPAAWLERTAALPAAAG